MNFSDLQKLEEIFLAEALKDARRRSSDFTGIEFDPYGTGGVAVRFTYTCGGGYEFDTHFIPQAEAEALIARVGQQEAQHAPEIGPTVHITGDAFLTSWRDYAALSLEEGTTLVFHRDTLPVLAELRLAVIGMPG